MAVRQYRVVRNKMFLRLAEQVNKLIENGWQPQGGIATDSEGFLYQAMVKR